MSRVEDPEDFGRSEDFGPYIGPNNLPYHDVNHLERSLFHQPSHRGFLKRLFNTKPASAEGSWFRRRLMRRIRRP